VFRLFCLTALWAVFSCPAAAQSCMAREDMVAALAGVGETPAARAIADVGGIIERFENRSADTWTITITLPDGRTCAIVTGRSWQALPVAKDRGLGT
jgi:hypothetical protein